MNQTILIAGLCVCTLGCAGGFGSSQHEKPGIAIAQNTAKPAATPQQGLATAPSAKALNNVAQNQIPGQTSINPSNYANPSVTPSPSQVTQPLTASPSLAGYPTMPAYQTAPASTNPATPKETRISISNGQANSTPIQLTGAQVNVEEEPPMPPALSGQAYFGNQKAQAPLPPAGLPMPSQVIYEDVTMAPEPSAEAVSQYVAMTALAKTAETQSDTTTTDKASAASSTNATSTVGTDATATNAASSSSTDASANPASTTSTEAAAETTSSSNKETPANAASTSGKDAVSTDATSNAGTSETPNAASTKAGDAKTDAEQTTPVSDKETPSAPAPEAAEGTAKQPAAPATTESSSKTSPAQTQSTQSRQAETVTTPAAEQPPKTPEPKLPKEPTVQPGKVQTGKAQAGASKDFGNINTSQMVDGSTVINYWHVDNEDVKKVLEVISRRAKMNLIVSPGVTGKVTIDIRNKTIDEVLQMVAKQCGLTIQRDLDVIYISTIKELRTIEENSELPVRVYHLNYITAGEAMKMISPYLTSKGKISQSPDSKVGLASNAVDVSSSGSSGSTAKVEAGGNIMAGGEILIVSDYELVLKKIDKIVAEIDIQPPQVMIEAVILQVTLDKGMELGVNFAVLDGADSALGVLGNGAVINSATGFSPSSVVTSAGKLTSGFAADTYGMKFGWTSNSTTGFIKALETRSETKILATPRLLVLNKQSADLQLGQNLGYQTQTVSQTSYTYTVNYLKIGTQLRIRPFVMPNGMIRMEVHPERTTGALDSNGIPQTKSAQVTSNVMIPNGFTMVIGGLIDDEITETWDGIPFLSRLPLLGYLFRHTVDSVSKKELVILLTPHIWNPSCPDETNRIGKPSMLNLEKKAQPNCMYALPTDGDTVYDILAAPPCNDASTGVVPANATMDPAADPATPDNTSNKDAGKTENCPPKTSKNLTEKPSNTPAISIDEAITEPPVSASLTSTANGLVQ